MVPKNIHRPTFRFTLYIAGESATSEVAIANLKKIEMAFDGDASIEVIDIEASPDIARENGVNITPTLIRTHPAPTPLPRAGRHPGIPALRHTVGVG